MVDKSYHFGINQGNKQGQGLVAKRGLDNGKGEDISEAKPLLKVWLGVEVGN